MSLNHVRCDLLMEGENLEGKDIAHDPRKAPTETDRVAAMDSKKTPNLLDVRPFLGRIFSLLYTTPLLWNLAPVTLQEI